MLRTHTCGELRLQHVNQQITLAGWVQRVRNKGGLIWVDLRDRYGVTQLIFEEGSTDKALLEKAAPTWTGICGSSYRKGIGANFQE